MTYSDLFTQLKDETVRDDLTTAQFDRWLRLVEAYMNRIVRTRGMVQRDTAPISDGYSTVPNDFLQARLMRLKDNPYTILQQWTPLQIATARQNEPSLTGTPVAYAIIGPEFEYWPVPSVAVTVELDYQQYVPALTAAAPTNWMLEQHPDAYFRGLLWQFATWDKDTALLSVNKPAFDEALSQINSADRMDATAFNITPTPSAYAV